ncbi:uncharacterized protein LOC130743781 [Lotus japonicus]|uniref:uncharacterized protein LOC130743781 n=1 Tax=Lotus japonicus TaxID=34305 RepID=UPI00258FDBC2|nr:uncharacterized protein LOC130743781 [Lotus japonicus]
MASRGSSHGQSSDFALHRMRGRWFSLYAAFLIMAGSGTMYLFGIYSTEIALSLGYDQSELRYLTFYKDFGANFAVMNGLFAEIAPSWLLLLLSAGMNFWAYFMIWLAVTQRVARPELWQMCFYIFIGANAPNFSGTRAIVTSVRNFPESRGVVLGLLKSYIGLSGPIFMQIHHALGGNDLKSLILFIAWFPAVINLVLMFAFREKKFVRQPQEMRVFYHYLYVSIAMAMFVMAFTIIQKHVEFSQVGYAGCAMVVFVMLFVLPLLISIREEHFDWTINNSYNKTNIENVPRAIQIQPKVNGYEHGNSSEMSSFFDKIFNKPGRGEDHTILQAILSMDMMYLFITTACGIGTGLTAINNLERIGEALGYPSRTIQAFSSLLNIWNYVGRVFSGFVSEYLLRKYKIPRPVMLTFMLALSSVGYILIAFPFNGSIYVACVIIGFSFGSQLPLVNAIISELFGLKHFSTLFNCGQSASPLGAYLLNAKIVQPNYERMSDSLIVEGAGVGNMICSGEVCFKDSFTVLASVAILGGFVSQILMERTKRFYEGDIYKRFRDPPNNNAEEQTSSSSAR